MGIAVFGGRRRGDAEERGEGGGGEVEVVRRDEI